MKAGWYYRPSDREILHTALKDEPPRSLGTAPRVVGVVAHLTDDGEPIRTEYQLIGQRQRRKRIITEDELDRGTWAAKLGMPRPSGNDARLAFATVIRRQALDAPEVPARTYYSEQGDLVLPDPDAQPFGYLTCAGTEENALKAWEEIGAWTMLDGNAALALGAVFVGPVLDRLEVLAHILNLYGPGQQGKSTALIVGAATLGDIKPRRQKLLMTWNASKQGITQGLRQRGYLPVALDEHSSSGRTVKESSREFSQIVAGAIREMGTADGSPRESDGFWHSVLLSSSNQPLRWQGQTEDLASRLQEIGVPFFPNRWVDAQGIDADPVGGAAEHLSKRLKRLAKSAGGWPLLWAMRTGMFQAERLAQLKQLHMELCAKHAPHVGGIPDTIAEIHMAWVVGAHMLGAAIDVPEIGATAEWAAAQRLRAAIQDAAEANLSDGERLWTALDALRIEASAYPDIEDVAKVANDSFRKVKGFMRGSEWWVLDPVVKQAGAEYGVENLMQALRQLDALGVHVRGEGDNAQRQVPRAVRGSREIPKRLHCFRIDIADAVFGGPQEEGGPTPGMGWTDPRTEVDRGGVGPVFSPVTWAGPSGPTGPTFSETDTHTRVEAPPEADVVTAYPTVVEAVTDPVWAKLRRSASAVGALAVDGLHLPNCAPVPLALPTSLDAVVPLMQAYELRTLYLHESALSALGLPDYDSRRDAGVGPQQPVEHPWATPGADSAITSMSPFGLCAWMTLKVANPRDPKRPTRLSVAVPAYEDRFDKAGLVGRGGFGGAEDGATLLDAVMVWTLSTLHGPEDRPQVIPYYMNPNKTGEDLAGGRGRTDVVCEAIRAKQVPPAANGQLVPVMVPPRWHREPTEDELRRTWVHQYDKTAAWMAAYSNVGLGIGEPVHAPDGIAYNGKWAAYWRVSRVPGNGLEGLPTLRFAEAPEGGYWLRTPAVELLKQIYPTWEPEVLEAWYWPETKRALQGMYRHLKDSREYILSAIAQGRPGAVWAKQVNGRIYQSFRGYLGRVKGPNTDHETGEAYAPDIYWRPDWAGLLLELACCNTYRALMGFAESGHKPLSLYVDAAAFASDEPDPLLAKPASMTIGDAGGNWGLEGSAPMAVLAQLLADGKSAHDAIDAYLNPERD
jgi:hypothetical protein